MFSKRKLVKKTPHIKPGTVVKVMRTSRCGVYLFPSLDHIHNQFAVSARPFRHAWILPEELVVVLEQIQRSAPDTLLIKGSKTFKVLTTRGDIGYIQTHETAEFDQGEWDAVWLEETTTAIAP